MTSDHDSAARDKAEDAIRARASLAGEAAVGGNETVAPGFAGAGHLGPLRDFELADGDDDVIADGDGTDGDTPTD
jgi:hypothetical protein